jgi:transposase InsO family protein
LRLKEEIDHLLKENTELTGFCTTHPKAEIYFNTIDELPVGVRQYELPYAHRKIVDDQVATWIKDGIIEDCLENDHSNNPLLVVPKRDISGAIKDWRTCIDPRLINTKIVDATYPIPKARNIFDALAGCIIYSVIDLKSGFNQIRVNRLHRKKTAFTWHKRIYQFVGAPFGFKNIPQDFQRIMDRIFQDLDFVNPYLDDLIVASSSYADHVRHVTMTIKRLNEVNLRVSIKKLKLAYPEIIVIGNKVSSAGVTVAVEKLDKMDHWKGKPVKTLKQLQQRLGFMNYFREYVPMYSRLMAPLEQLRSEGNQIKWKLEHDEIIEKFEKILRNQITISFPDFSKQMVVSTDASKYGLGAVLYQLDVEEGTNLEVSELLQMPKKYIRMASRSLNPSECNYGAPQRELLGVLFALRSFRPYLFGHQFRLLTDHKSLTYMLERPKVSSVIYNWLDEIMQFNFRMEHVPGNLNVLPDLISRIYDFDDRTEVPKIVLMTIQDTDQELTCDLEDLEVVTDLETRESLLNRAHSHGHFGAADMARTIRSSTRSTWPNLVRDCQKVVSSCIPCQRYNIGKMGYHPPRSVQALMPLDHIAIDLKQMPISSKGNVYYLLVIDVATRFVFLRPLASKTAYAVAQPLLRLFCDLGFPKVLQSDNGGEFVNEVMTALKNLAGIDQRVISAYHHRSNGMAERAIQSTSNAVYKAISGLIDQWDDYLPAIQHAFNTRCIELHGSSPYALLFGRAPNNFADYRDTDLTLEKAEDREKRLLFLNSVVFPAIKEKVSKAHAKRVEYFEKTHRMHKSDFPAGSQVMVRDEMKTAKHQPTFEGPFTVLRRKASGNYEIKGLDGKTYIRSPWVLKLAAPEIIKSLNVPDTIFAAVEKIIEHRETPGGGVQYRVRWDKAGPELDSWLFKEDFIDYGPLQAYSKKQGVDLRTKKLSVEGNQKKEKTPKDKQKNQSTIAEPEESVLQGLPSIKKVHEGVIAEGIPVEISLNSEQKDALGAYWQRTKSISRSRKQPIVESDSE